MCAATLARNCGWQMLGGSSTSRLYFNASAEHWLRVLRDDFTSIETTNAPTPSPWGTDQDQTWFSS